MFEFDGNLYRQKVAQLSHLKAELDQKISQITLELARDMDQRERAMFANFLNKSFRKKDGRRGRSHRRWQRQPPNAHD